MPQMMPMWWLFMFMFMVMNLLISTCMLYFFFIINPKMIITNKNILSYNSVYNKIIKWDWKW